MTRVDGRVGMSGRRARRGGLAVALGMLAATIAGCGAAASAAPATAVAASATSAAPAPAAQVVPATSRPVRVQIPAIGVNSPLMDLGLQADGSLEVPAQGFPAGWFTGGPAPGELGPAVLAGHVDWGGSAGVFYRLHELVAGEEITVDRRDGSAAIFQVKRVERFAKNAFPTSAVYGNIDHPGLRVITCGGAFDHQAHSYVDDVVVFADLIGTRPGPAAADSRSEDKRSG